MFGRNYLAISQTINKLKNWWKKRYEQFITKAHMLVNTLHPALQGKILSAEEVNITMKDANEKYATLVPVIMKFQAKSPF